MAMKTGRGGGKGKSVMSSFLVLLAQGTSMTVPATNVLQLRFQRLM